MKCDICSLEAQKEIELAGTKFNLCGWCEFRTMQWVHGNKHNFVANIYWGAGRIDWGSWYTVRDILRKYNIKEVLELGIGLSSELFVNEGVRLTGFDVLKQHVEMYQNLCSTKEHATFHHYEYGKIPPVEELYPNKKWDFVFVDGPQERSREVKVAMKLSNKFIFLHDPNMGEQEFFPNDEWKLSTEYNKLYVKI